MLILPFQNPSCFWSLLRYVYVTLLIGVLPTLLNFIPFLGVFLISLNEIPVPLGVTHKQNLLAVCSFILGKY